MQPMLKTLIIEFLRTQPEQQSKILYVTQYIGERVLTILEPLWVRVYTAMRELVHEGVVRIIWKVQADKRTFKHDMWGLV